MSAVESILVVPADQSAMTTKETEYKVHVVSNIHQIASSACDLRYFFNLRPGICMNTILINPLFHFPALTTCENKRLEIKYRHSDEVIAVPRCNEDGSFAEIQCLPRLNKCWCVDKHGRERNGTRQNGKPTICKARGPGTRYFVVIPADS